MNKVTLESIKAKIKAHCYLVLPDGRTTICMLSLENGYTIKGMSACVDAANFDIDLGRKYAYEDAIRQIWPLEGYLLAERLFWDRAMPVATNPPKTKKVPSVLEEAHKLLNEEIRAEMDKQSWTVTAKSNGTMVAAVKKRGRPAKVDAPWGLKKDGTPKKRPGRAPKAAA